MPETVLPDLRILLRSDGTALLVELTGGLPVILHWGADLGELTAQDAAAIAAATAPGRYASSTDHPTQHAVLPEQHAAWTGRPGISGSRQGRDWSPKFTGTAASLDGAPIEVTPGGETPLVTAGPAALLVEATDDVARLALKVWIELCTGGVVRMRAELTNTATGENADYQLDDLVLAYPLPAVAREILDFAGRWGKERTPQRRELVVGTHLREGRHGRTGADAATVLHVGTPGFSFTEGEIWGVHTGWSGNHTHYAERSYTGEQVLGGGELLLPGEVVLRTGESYTSPWIYGSYGIGLDQVARRFHRMLRARPQHVDAERPVTLNVWEAVYFDHSLPKLLELADRAAALGVERFVLDDGWFGARRNDHAGLGDWTVSADVWPDGLHPLVDKVTGLGMQFGLWFEPEMVNLDSDVARAHPEWVMATGGRLPVEARHQQVLNLGIPECYDYIRDAISAILDEYDIGYIKWDHNRDLVDAGTSPTGIPGVHAQTLATYRLIDELKAAHPGLEIESCSSGGARVDLGILERTDRVWVSDNIDPLDRQQMNRWTTQLIPPELMGSHIASGRSHTTGRFHDIGFRAATAVFGHLGIEWDLTQATEDELDQLRGWIEFFKAERGLLLRGDLLRVDYPDTSVYANGVVAPDRSRGIFSIASVARSDVNATGLVRLPGLDRDRRYRVGIISLEPALDRFAPPWWSPQKPYIDLTGAALASVGVQPPSLPPEQAVLFRVDPLSD
ncbi:alpha-galactosidase [Microlunatus sp. Gsoil 973]|uniref:alpha-galactosidase n=1 Tax=Microlunatus sp. Gsoil 973 TaxID=2672569 RepID=UPI0012B4DE2B|nr:alpha-galactosidase [Microlunatus sp. Gsoil 973]QGN31810.1 alpha-galactosidase [Microlunatus sp. Gsoil 973]